MVMLERSKLPNCFCGAFYKWLSYSRRHRHSHRYFAHVTGWTFAKCIVSALSLWLPLLHPPSNIFLGHKDLSSMKTAQRPYRFEEHVARSIQIKNNFQAKSPCWNRQFSTHSCHLVANKSIVTANTQVQRNKKARSCSASTFSLTRWI